MGKSTDAEACPGADPGVCARNREGIACGACRQGYFLDFNRACIECQSIHTSRVLFPILPVLLGPPLVLLVAWRSQDDVAQWASPANSCSAALYIWLCYVQTLASIAAGSLK